VKSEEKRILFVGLSAPHDKHKIGSLIIRLAEAPNRNIFKPSTWFNTFFASHTFIVHPAHRSRPFYLVNEAAGTMIRWIAQKHFENRAEILSLYKFEISKELYREIKLYGEKHSGAPYSFRENIGIGFVRLWALFTGKRIKNPFSQGEAAQKCSELVFRNVIMPVLNAASFEWELSDFCRIIELETGEYLPPDFDLLGVRDTHVALEFLSKLELCEKMPIQFEMKVGA